MKPKKALTPKHFGIYEKLSSIQNRQLGVSSCALASGCKVIVSGDKHLLKVSGYEGIEVLNPRAFVDTYLV